MQIEGYNNGGKIAAPTSMQDLRSYSANYAGKDLKKMKKMKSTNGKATKGWSFSDPEMQRKKRIAGYKVYTMEGKMKGSIRKSFRWIKNTCTQVVNGIW